MIESEEDVTPAAPPSGLPTAHWLHRRLLTLTAMGAMLAVVIGALLFLFGMDFTPRQIRLSAVIVALASVPMLLLDILVINLHFRPIGTFLRRLPLMPTQAATAAALVQALNLPVLTTLRIMLVHLPSFALANILLVLLANRYLDLGMQAWQFATGVLLMLFYATAHAIFEYFAVGATMRPITGAMWQYCDRLSPEQRRRIIPVPMRRKLLAVSATVVFIPLFLLGISVLAKVNQILAGLGVEDAASLAAPLRAWVMLLVIGLTALMFYMAIALSRDITRSSGELVQAMGRVEKEELGTRLAVTTTDEFAALYEGFNRMTRGLRERERLRHAFGCYVTPELAEGVMREGVHLGGETVQASVLFADIRGFTALAERMSPDEVVGLLNRYFTALEPAIRSEGGWINSFGGDSLLAIFGAPVPAADHTQRAVRAALGIRAALSEFNREQRELGGPALRIGMGIHCGQLVAGSVGSPQRMEYTVIGDVVNVTSRIDGLNKKWGTDILISAEVCAGAGPEIPARAMPPSEVPGKSEPIQVYALE